MEEARKFPNVEFRHPTSLWKEGKDPDNAGGYYSYMDQGHYVNGIAVWLSTKTNKIGYIAAKPIGLRVTQRQFLHRGREEGQSGGRGSTYHHRRLVASRQRGGIGEGAD